MEQTVTNNTATIQSFQTEEKKEQVVHLELEKIIPDPDQPRKSFNENAIEELVQSIKSNGVIQPILVRPHNKGYMIVFGERRYRASVAIRAVDKDRNTIPAIVRDLSDAESREIQNIENLQREDIGLMEQARGFKILTQQYIMTTEEIAQRVGKSVYFVRQQLKLNDLTSKWQRILEKKAISLSTALKICVLPVNLQKDLYENHVSKEDEESEKPVVFINDYVFNQYKGLLNDACFDISDPNLDKKMGACTSCPFNSALTSLFASEDKNPKCSNVLCFKNKQDKHLQQELEKAKNDPAALFIYKGHNTPALVEQLKKEGLEVLREGYGDECKEVRKPEKPIWDNFLEEAKHRKLSQKVAKTEFEKKLQDFDFQSSVFEKKLAVGKYKKAFMISSNSDKDTGKYFYVELTPKADKKSSKKAILDGTPNAADIDNEISRIQERETRAKELDLEKVHRRIVETVKAHKLVDQVPTKTAQSDNLLICFLLLEHLTWSTRQDVQKVIKSPGLWKPNNREDFQRALRSLTKGQIAYLIKKIMIDKYSSQLSQSTAGYMFRLMSESLGVIPIADYEKEQKEMSIKRQERVNQNTDKLKQLKKEIVKTAKNTINQDKNRKQKKAA